MPILIGFLFVMLLFTVGIILKGWVLSILWGWFVAPVFHLPQLSVVVAIGVSLALSYTINGMSARKSAPNNAGEDVITLLIGPLFVLFIGWIIHQFMPVLPLVAEAVCP